MAPSSSSHFEAAGGDGLEAHAASSSVHVATAPGGPSAPVPGTLHLRGLIVRLALLS